MNFHHRISRITRPCMWLGALVCLLSITPALADDGAGNFFLRRSKLMATTPTHTGPGVRVWRMREDARSLTNLVELKGVLRRHIHPDARHSIMVVEGEIWFHIGNEKTEKLLVEGDYVSIDAGVPHKYTVKGDRALLVTFDAPANKKTTFLE